MYKKIKKIISFLLVIIMVWNLSGNINIKKVFANEINNFIDNTESEEKTIIDEDFAEEIITNEDIWGEFNEENHKPKSIRTLLVSENTVSIKTPEDLDNIRGNLNGNYILENDIDLKNENWKPIGTKTSPFTGTLDGMDFKIKNLFIDSYKEQGVGLFGVVASGKLENINIENVDIKSYNFSTGSLFGYAKDSKINNVNIIGTINLNNPTFHGRMGGLFGDIYNSTVTNSSVSGEGKVFSDRSGVGGFGGCMTNSTVEKSYSEGVLVQINYYHPSGFIGACEGTDDYIVNCFSTCDVIGVNGGSGIIFGRLGNSDVTIENCYYAGSNRNPLVGTRGKIEVINSYYDSTKSNASNNKYDENRTTEEMMMQETFEGWDFENVWSIEEGKSYPQLTKDELPKDDGEIWTVEDLQGINYDLGKSYRLMSDIDLNGTIWTPLGDRETPFFGEFNGNNYTISNLEIKDNGFYTGLFGYVKDAKIKNLYMENFNIESIRTTNYDAGTGALIGRSDNSSISNVHINNLKIYSNSDGVGGIVGRLRNNSMIENSSSSGVGKVLCDIASAGGISGELNDSTMQKCSTSIDVQSYRETGGLVGTANYNSSVINSYSTSKVISIQSDRMGGLIGAFWYGTGNLLKNSYFAGEVSKNLGLVGVTGSGNNIVDSYFNLETVGSNVPIEQARTTEEMMMEKTYTGWDFENIWTIDEGKGYPQLTKNKEPSIDFEIPNLIVQPGNLRMNITWDKISDDSIISYKLFKIENGKEVFLEGFKKDDKYEYIDHKLIPGKEYTYYLEATNNLYIKTKGSTFSNVPINIDDYNPNAIAGSNVTTLENKSILFDASESYDNLNIVSYLWDFGDGSTSNLKTPAYIYNKAGIYDVVLTVKDAAGNTDTDIIKAEILKESNSGTISLKVTDLKTGRAIPNAFVFIKDGDDSKNYKTNSSGIVEIIGKAGEYKISAFATNYLPKEINQTLILNKTTNSTISLEKSEVVVANVESEKLNIDQIIEKGIDIKNPENNHVFEMEVTLVFEGEKLPPYKVITNGSGNIVGGTGGSSNPWTGGGSGGSSWTGSSGGTYYPIIVPNEDPEIPPSIVILKIPTKVTFLKEFFEVSLIVQNMAPEQFVMEGNSSLLNLPDGLSLVVDLDAEQLMDDIPGGQMGFSKWIVRGDKSGSYEFSANFNGTLMPFGAPINASFKTPEPLEVSDMGEDFDIHVHVNPRGTPGKMYYVDFEFINDSKLPRHNFELTIGNAEKRINGDLVIKNPATGETMTLDNTPKKYSIKDQSYSGSLPVLKDGDSIKIETLEAGTMATVKYGILFPINEDIKDITHYLKDMFVVKDEDNTVDMKVTIFTKPCNTQISINCDTKSCDVHGVDTTGRGHQQESLSSLIGSDIPFYLKNDSGYNQNSVFEDLDTTLENETDNIKLHNETKTEKAKTGDFGIGGWFTNLDMFVEKNEDLSLNLYYTANDFVNFTKKSLKDGEFTGTDDGEYIHVTHGNAHGEYITNIPGYENHVLTLLEDGSFTLKNNSPYFYTFGKDGKLLKVIDSKEKETTITYEDQRKIIKTKDKTVTIIYDDSNRIVEINSEKDKKAIFEYDTKGNLVSIKNHNDDYTIYEYDDFNRITKVKTNKSQVSYEYDENHRITKETDIAGNSNLYSYEESQEGELTTTITDRNGNISISVGDTYGLIKSRTDALGNIEKYFYDERGNITSVVDKNGNVLGYEYNDKNLVTKFTNQMGVSQLMNYDSNGNLVETIYPNGSKDAKVYDSKNNLLESIGINGLSNNYTYDDEGKTLTSTNINGMKKHTYDGKNLVKTEDFDGSVESYSYDENDNLISQTNKLGNITTYIYDSKDRLIETKDYKGLTIKNEYDEKDNLIKVISKEGLITSYEYDYKNNLLKTINPEGLVKTSEYDSKSRLSKETNIEGITTSYDYDDKDNLIRTIDSRGYETAKSYNISGKIISETNIFKETTTYEYDRVGQIIKTSYSDGTQERNIYDQIGRVISRTDKKGATTTYSYDPMGNVLTTTLASGGTITNTYYKTGFLDSTTNEFGYTIKNYYNNMNQIYKVENSEGHIEFYTYDTSGNVISIKDKRGYEVKFTYDSFGRKISETDKNNNTIIYSYDNYDRLIKITDPLGNETKMVYDIYGRLIKNINPRGGITTQTYDDNGNVNAITNPLGETVSMEYNYLGNLVKVINSKGIAIENYEYDSQERVVKIKNQDGIVVESYDYDSLGRLIKVTDAFGNTKESVYKGYNQVIKNINELNEETSYDYDIFNNLTKVTDGEGNETKYEYNITNQLASLTDPNGSITSFEYDIAGNVIKENLSMGVTREYKYDSRSRIIEIINARGQSITYSYDDGGLPTNIDGTTFTYDGNGNPLTTTNQEGIITREYDALNRIASYRDVNGRQIKYAYDESSNLTSITYPGGEVVTYEYNLLNQMIKVIDYKGRITEYSYDNDNLGRLIETKLPEGTVETYFYDIMGRSVQTKKVINGVESIINYEYDKAGKIISEDIDSIPNSASETVTSSLLSDGIMNYLAGNQIDTFNNKKINYDADGNMIYGPLGGAMSAYEYDKTNKLIKASNTTYTYDGEGTRIKQITNGNTTSYVTDLTGTLSRLLLKSNPDGTETIYIYGNGLISQETKTINEGKVSYDDYRVFHYDYRGSTIALTNENGKTTDTFLYGPYGELISHKGLTKTIFKFQGNYGIQTDDNSLIYMRNRYYNVELKRFITMDPIKDSFNWYGYVEGDPVNNLDLDGLRTVEVPSGKYIEKNGKIYVDVRFLLEEYGIGYKVQKLSGSMRITANVRGMHQEKLIIENSDVYGGSSYYYHNEIGGGSFNQVGIYIDVKQFQNIMCYMGYGRNIEFVYEGNGDTYYKNGSITSSYKSKAEMYRFTEMKICTDGSIDYDGQANHQRETAYFLGSYLDPIYMNPVKMHYVVIPMNYAGNAKKGDIAVVIDKNTGNYVYAIIGDVGPNDKYEEVSISTAWDLGFETDGTYGPVGDFEYILFPETKIDWGTDIDVLQEKINQEGKKYYNIGGA